MNRILEIDWEETRGSSPAACSTICDEAEERHLTFGPDPATHNRNTFGGMIGNNSCGMHAQMAGKMEENVEELEIVTYDGLRMRVGPTPEEELERIIAEGGRKAKSTATQSVARSVRRPDSRAFPDIPRRVSGFPLQRTTAREWFQRRARTGRHGEHVRHRRRGDGSPRAQSAVSRARDLRFSRSGHGRPTTCRSATRTARSRSKAWPNHVPLHGAQGRVDTGRAMFPTVRPG